VVLDSSAVLAVLFEEPGADVVRQHVSGASLGVANLAEVLAKLGDRGVSADHGVAAVDMLGMDIRPMTKSQAILSAGMRGATRNSGLSLADRACLALAKELGTSGLTADRQCAAVADAVGVRVELIR